MVDRSQISRVPPNNLEAERSVLGACLLDKEAFATVEQIISPDDFYQPAHKKIFEAMLNLDNNNKPIDEVTLAEELSRTNILDNIGGQAYISSLSDNVPTAANAESYANIIHEKAIARLLITAGSDIVTKARDDNETIDSLLSMAEESIFKIAKEQKTDSFQPMKEVVQQNFQTIQALVDHKGPISGVETGYEQLDKVTTGLQPGNLIIIAARPGMGKTAFALNIAQNTALKYNNGVAVFSMEMSTSELGMRLICSQAHLGMQKIKEGKIDRQDLQDLVEAAGQLSGAPIYINDRGGMDLYRMKSMCRRLKLEHENVRLIIIDYLQLMSATTRKDGNREQEIAEISRGLKSMAKELELPIIALSQLSRNVESRTSKEPQLSDLRESGAIEQDADMVIFIHRPDYYDKDDEKIKGLANIIIAKHRNGPTDKIQLTFIPECVRFENLEEHHTENY